MTHRMLLRCIAATFCICAGFGPAGASPGSWLDKKPVTAWNKAGAPIPHAPKPNNDNRSACASNIRRAASAADKRLAAAGWQLVGASLQFGGTSVIQAAAGFDGMCRWSGYQAFVFVNGTYAGTLAPAPMESRSDGALSDVHLYSATNVAADFTRYAESDPLCCPSRMSSVTYAFARKPGGTIVAATEVTTGKP